MFWHESFARNVADLAAGRRPTPLRGTLAALGERTRTELGSLDVEVLLGRLMAAQSVIRRDVGAPGIELIPYRQGRVHIPTEHLRITVGHLDHHAADARDLATIDPSLILDGPTPRLLDEWQTVPAVWNHVRRAVDDRRAPGQFIPTGSSVPADDATRHSGAGRFLRLRMRPMSLFESGHSTGSISLGALLRGDASSSAQPQLTVPDIADRICIGGWPGHVDQPFDVAARPIRGYLDEVRRVDVAAWTAAAVIPTAWVDSSDRWRGTRPHTRRMPRSRRTRGQRTRWTWTRSGRTSKRFDT